MFEIVPPPVTAIELSADVPVVHPRVFHPSFSGIAGAVIVPFSLLCIVISTGVVFSKSTKFIVISFL